VFPEYRARQCAENLGTRFPEFPANAWQGGRVAAERIVPHPPGRGKTDEPPG
jgi:hypothetical protein